MPLGAGWIRVHRLVLELGVAVTLVKDRVEALALVVHGLRHGPPATPLAVDRVVTFSLRTLDQLVHDGGGLIPLSVTKLCEDSIAVADSCLTLRIRIPVVHVLGDVAEWGGPATAADAVCAGAGRALGDQKSTV